MSTRNIQIEGLKELTDQLVRIGGVGGLKVLASASRAAMLPALRAAKEKVPVDSGELRDSLKIAVVKPKEGNIVCSAGLAVTKRKVRDEIPVYGSEGELQSFERGSKTVDASWRWHFVEFGSIHNTPKPFLRPAFEENVDRSLAILTEKLKKAIAKAIESNGSVDVGFREGGGAFPLVGGGAGTGVSWFKR